MRAAIVQDGGRPLSVVSLADPTPEAGELVLRVRSAGVCGTDLHLAGEPLGVMPGSVLGHEFAGEVVAVGPRLEGWREGERVAALPVIGCGQCAACFTGDTMGCPRLRMIGSGDLPGGFAEYVRVGARECFRLPDALDNEAGALVEPLAVGLHAVRVAALQPGENVLVLGGGPIGLAIATWARALGAGEIAVADRLAPRRELAARFGASQAIDADDDAAWLALTERCGGLPDVVFECVGSPGLLQQCVQQVRRRGRIIVAGACMASDSLMPAMACLKEVDVRFVVAYSHHDFAWALHALASGRIAGKEMITGHVDLDGLPATFTALRTPSTQCKVIVCP
jgi:(R,R)-butanediol dehydrogenase/meso-butanediol dehydrogenase/diacetyl reductase